ncbi:MAG: hypothetical protein ABSD03_15775, partial [Vulcanimicrobiaceae bacterium]
MATLSMSDLPDDDQRAALEQRLGQDGLELFLGRYERGETVDGATAQRAKRGPVTALPRNASASDGRAVRSTRARREDGTREALLAGDVEDLGPADDTQLSVDLIMAREDARRARGEGGVAGDPDQVPGETYEGLDEIARGKKRVRGKSGSDKGPKARRRPTGGEPMAHENWDHLRGGRVRPVVVSARVTTESKDALDADQSVSNGQVMEGV